MPETPRWRAWVWDGGSWAVYSSAYNFWADLQGGVVGVVVYFDPPYRRIIDGHDWVWMEGGRFHEVPTHPEWGKWAEPPPGVDDPDLKRGGPVPDGPWAEIQREMREAREAP